MQTTAELPTQQIEFVKKGQVTIPKSYRDKYSIEPGGKGTIVDLGGAILITPTESTIPNLLTQLCEQLGTADMSLEDMVAEMRRIRDTPED
jgi:bifunctional DNA-binding transcriptional regulator/antitoxin component of YhaV-PrlF toxin-antitoxin module